MNRTEILATFDREMRREPALFPGVGVERVGSVVRLVGAENMVLYSRLTEADARSVVHAEAEHFRALGVPVEWKWFGHDTPADLPAILAAEGFVAEEGETLVVYDLHLGTPGAPAGPGVDIHSVRNERELREAWEANREAFGGNAHSDLDHWAEMWRDPTQRLFVAYVDGRAVSSGRLDMPRERSFAGMFGGGTRPEFRHRGIYRGLVAARAAEARARGYRYLTVDARETSRPILERLGFEPLTTTRPWVLTPTGST
jgi:GNAT superfamily N-acetyltransferase